MKTALASSRTFSSTFLTAEINSLKSQMQKLKQHQPKCDVTVEYDYPCGVCKNKLHVFGKLEEMGVLVHEEDKYKWFAYYDFEACQRDFREGVDQLEEMVSEEGTSWNDVHLLCCLV